MLYSRCLRDYLLYAALRRLISVYWSQRILDDTTKYLRQNRENFDEAAAKRLVAALTRAFPDATVQPSAGDYTLVSSHHLPDPDDREVIAAALTAEADIICTNNMVDFQANVMSGLGLIAMTPDDLFCRLIEMDQTEMIEVHRTTVSKFTGATDASALSALHRAQATKTSARMAAILGLSESDYQ